MAKEFKDYDMELRTHVNTWLEYELEARHIIEAMAAKMVYWFRTDDTVVYTEKSVLEAVYESTSAEAWQRFRVSLKGFSSKEKLARLEYRWKLMHRLEDEGLTTPAHTRLERIRIDNYVFALRRDGQLNKEFKIVK